VAAVGSGVPAREKTPGTTIEERLTCRSTGALQVLHLDTCYYLGGYPGHRYSTPRMDGPSIPAAFPLLQAHSWIGKHFPGKALTVRGFREPEKSAAGVVEALIVRSVVTRVR
jgi:hypothetical protein